MPAVLPVDFAVEHDGAVPLRTAAGSAPARAFDRAVAAFRTGDVDVARRAGPPGSGRREGEPAGVPAAGTVM
ncbi:hypothetical protein ACF052_22440 [Streptomyces pilosus]|uniref:hypothetical protein n=1 Tax=Streptomyces pilosus TaxID=28893 RepID=UPI0036FDAEE0